VIALALSAAQAGSGWPWEAGLMRRLGAERAAAVAACRERLALRPRAQALVDAVMAAMQARFDEARSSAPEWMRRAS
jgi:hypothetical protein